ncbi:MAG: AAA family ATPase [Gemmatimonadaceae bacterium]
MPFLKSVSLKPGAGDGYPFTVPVVRALETLAFPTDVTFLVGENGSGKSTLLEAIAAAAKLPAVGSESVERDATLTPARMLAKRLRLTWRSRTHRGFFLRAEDFFGFTKYVARMRADTLQEIRDVTDEYRAQDRSDKALGLRLMPLTTTLAAMEQRYGVDLDASSHGQSFLKLFESRFVAGGLYLLDEPEAPLSPQSQLALIAMMAGMLAEGAQFIIATHSPILLAFPGATIYSCDRAPIEAVPYDELDHVTLTREFLASPATFIRHLMPGV